MKQDIVIPRMGESITEATIGTILKPNGSAVNVDDEILELETEKVNQVLYSPASGTVHLTVNPSDNVKIGQKIGYIDTDEKGAEKSQPPEPRKEETKSPKSEVPAKSRHPGTSKEEAKGTPAKTEQPVASAPTASKAVLRKGKEEFLSELASKSETPSEKKSEPAKRATAAISSRTERRQKLPKIRRVIAERLVEAQHNAAMLSTFNEVDLTQIILLRERYKELFVKEYDVKLGYMSFFVKASVSALRAFPEVNAYLDGEDLVYREYFDIGIAVSTDRGLVVPVLRNCDLLPFAEIEQKIDELSQKARQGSLTIEDLQGGGFTITNGGVFGSLLSTPILNPPQSAILGMHKIVKRPIAINDQVIIRPMMYLALTYDHRVLDGREAVSFLVHIKECLEDPARLLLEI